MLGKVFHAPVQSPKRILDIGCGTGVMTVKLANMFPDAQVIGLDISPVPDIHERPSNVEYVQGDFMELVGGDNPKFALDSFDYVFARLLSLGIRDWPGLISKIYKVLAPGGWIELQDNETAFIRNAKGEVDNNPPGAETWRVFVDDVSSAGLDLSAPGKFPDYMKDTGFVDIHGPSFRFHIAKPLPTQPEGEMFYEYFRKYTLPLICGIFDKVSKPKRGEEEMKALRQFFIDEQTKPAWEPGAHTKFLVVVGRKP